MSSSGARSSNAWTSVALPPACVKHTHSGADKGGRFERHSGRNAAPAEPNAVVGGPRGAAQRLGLKRTTLLSRMQKMGI